jgi:hypothetical protein
MEPAKHPPSSGWQPSSGPERRFLPATASCPGACERGDLHSMPFGSPKMRWLSRSGFSSSSLCSTAATNEDSHLFASPIDRPDTCETIPVCSQLERSCLQPLPIYSPSTDWVLPCSSIAVAARQTLHRLPQIETDRTGVPSRDRAKSRHHRRARQNPRSSRLRPCQPH